MDQGEYADRITKVAHNHESKFDVCIAVQVLALPIGTILLAQGYMLAGWVTLIPILLTGIGAWCLGRRTTSAMKILAEYIRRTPEGKPS